MLPAYNGGIRLKQGGMDIDAHSICDSAPAGRRHRRSHIRNGGAYTQRTIIIMNIYSFCAKRCLPLRFAFDLKNFTI